jgi:hypothetical protein
MGMNNDRIPPRVSAAFGLGSIVALVAAVVVARAGYSHALDNACPDGSALPAAYWPLILLSLAGAFASYKSRPRTRNDRGERSGADVFALILIFLMPVALLVTVFFSLVSYACWE